MAELIGMVGMGLMGQSYIKNLRAAGFDIQGFDIDSRRREELRAQGGTPVESPAAAARGVDTVILSLPNSAVVRETVLGPVGIVEGAARGLLIIDTTTARPDDSAALAAELAARQIRFLDAAVSGTSVMARDKNLIVIAGGRPEDFQAATPVLAGFSRAQYHMGASGAGAMTKLIINAVLLGNMFALAEGMLLGMKAGVDSDRLLAVLKDGAAGSKAMDQKGQMMVSGVYVPPHGAVSTSIKDAKLMLEQSETLGAPLPLVSLTTEALRRAEECGWRDQDWACFLEVLRETAGLGARI